jgi:hypothetical protein
MAGEFDLNAGHRFFSAQCFNAAWDLIDKSARSAADDAQMLAAAGASLWHWLQRPDVTPRNRSVGYWQVSRVLAMLGYGEPARSFARLCLESSRGEEPFYLAYAYECLGRAASLCGEHGEARSCVDLATRLAELVQDDSSRLTLQADLQTIATS